MNNHFALVSGTLDILFALFNTFNIFRVS